MKWWTRIKDLKHNRWLPFYLPIIGTLLYIGLVLIAIPTELSDKDKDADAEPAPSASARAAPRATAARRSRGPSLGPKPPGSAAVSKPQMVAPNLP